MRRILTVAAPDHIILFGSAATGTMTKDSDLDLLIVERAPENTLQESVRIRRALRGLGYPIDVMVIRTARFNRTKEVFGGIADPAHKYGRVLYEAA